MTPPSGGVTLQDASDGTLVLPANLSLERCEPSAKSSLEALWLTAPLKPSDVQVEIGPHASEEARLMSSTRLHREYSSACSAPGRIKPPDTLGWGTRKRAVASASGVSLR